MPREMNFLHQGDSVVMHMNDKIYIAGHTGMVGSAIVRRLGELGYRNLVLKTRDEVDLSDYEQVSAYAETCS